MSTARIRKLLERLPALKSDAILVTDDINISYLTGLQARESWLLVTGRGSFYITDARYSLEAEVGLKGRGVKVVCFQDSCAQAAVQLASRCQVKSLGVNERHLTVAQYRRLKALLPAGMKLRAADEAVEALRMIKDPAEIAAIREALAINLEAFKYLDQKISPGRTEQDLLADLEAFAGKRKVGLAFPPIIAAGPNSAMPHASVSVRKIRRGEPLLIDCGIRKNGYNSDLTRMFFLDKMTPSYREILDHIREAQQAAIRLIKPGVLASEVDAAARASLKQSGDLDRYFTHSLGHGVGLEVHEMPRISGKSGVRLAENMVITVEPGVYFKGRYGVRLEEMVLVTKSGCEVLSGNYN
ncbi:MAG: aminopeptidase P family protein [Candidatus Omnitrophica bacterium]|nr:aminopeptidase P family protein [Candidatus Omnitrophota bacterium]